MTYKKAIKICTDILKSHGLSISRSAQKQAGYLALFATEGEVSKNLHHELKALIKELPCNFEPGSIGDQVFSAHMDRYAKLLQAENPDGGEISLGWLLKEAHGKEMWNIFSGSAV